MMAAGMKVNLSLIFRLPHFLRKEKKRLLLYHGVFLTSNFSKLFVSLLGQVGGYFIFVSSVKLQN